MLRNETRQPGHSTLPHSVTFVSRVSKRINKVSGKAFLSGDFDYFQSSAKVVPPENFHRRSFQAVRTPLLQRYVSILLMLEELDFKQRFWVNRDFILQERPCFQAPKHPQLYHIIQKKQKSKSNFFGIHNCNEETEVKRFETIFSCHSRC